MAAKTLFNIPFAGVDKNGEYDLLIGLNVEYSVIINLINPVIRYSAYPSGYEEFHHLLINIVKVLGDGYILQKQDIISRSAYKAKQANEYLQQKFNEHFDGRECLKVDTYLVVTRQVKKGAFYVYDAKALRDFRQAIGKVLDILPSAVVLKENRINRLVMQMLSMDFKSPHISLNNLAPTDTEIRIGERSIRNITLVNIDSIDLPPEVSTYIELNDKESMRGFPVDFLSFLFKVPGCDVIIYNQLIEIPNQVVTLRKLEQKKKRHSGIPDPANLLCVEDIDQLLLDDVARENQLLVNSHFNILVVASESYYTKGSQFY